MMHKKQYIIKNITRSLALGGVLLFIQSCFVAKQYSRPDSSVVQRNYRGDALPSQTDSVPPAPWKAFFKDSILIEHIATALENNKNYRISLENVKMAKASLKQSRASLLPSANATAQWKEQIEGDQPGFYNLAADVSWEIDVWGKLTSQQRAAKASLFKSEEDLLAMQSMLISQLAQSYLFIMSLDAQLAISENTLEIRKEHIRTVKALKEAGMLNEANIQQSIAQFHGVEILVRNLKQQIFVQENSFRLLLGKAAGTVNRAQLENFEINKNISVGVPADLLANRPDVRSAEWNLREAFQMKNAAKANFYPSLRINAQVGYQGLELKDWIQPSSLFFSTLSSLSQPIFNQRAIRTQYEQSLSREQIALLSFEDKLLQAGKEVSDALYAISNNNELQKSMDEQLKAQEKATKISEDLLDQGLVNYIDVLMAQESALNTKLSWSKQKYQNWIDYIQLYKALGGGVK